MKNPLNFVNIGTLEIEVPFRLQKVVKTDQEKSCQNGVKRLDHFLKSSHVSVDFWAKLYNETTHNIGVVDPNPIPHFIFDPFL